MNHLPNTQSKPKTEKKLEDETSKLGFYSPIGAKNEIKRKMQSEL